MSTHGPHANSLEDMWQVAIEMAKRCGGDRGSLGLMGPDTLPAAIRPNRLIVLETEGWPEVDAATKAGFARMLGRLTAAGVTLIHRGDHPFVESLEKAIANARAICNGITSWENRWYQRGMLDASPNGLSERAKQALFRAEAMTPDPSRTTQMARQPAQATQPAVASFADAAITLACPGPAPRSPIGSSSWRRKDGRSSMTQPRRASRRC
jgi:hypothetical protein